MDDDPTSALPGAMAALLRKLDSIMAPENNLPRDVREKVKLMMHRIKKTHKSFVDLSELEEPPLMAKLWMKQVQELYNDMEDKFAQAVNFDAAEDVSEGTIMVANKMLEFFESRVQDSCEQKIYGFDSLTNRRFVSYGPRRRLPACHKDLIDHGPMEELVNYITTERDKQLKVASILGVGGVGKTTLATRIYQKLRGRFECRAFVRVTSNPDMRRLLTSLFIQIQRQQPHENWDANDLIHNISRYLAHKRYFILIDDIWSASVWDITRRAFPTGHSCSRVITTTQVEDVALTCCSYLSDSIFEMRTLDEEHSRQLFFSRVFGCEENCPAEFRELSYEIIRQCGGLPLSIVNIASLFEGEPVMLIEHWQRIHHSLCCDSWMKSSYLLRQHKEVSFISSDDILDTMRKVTYLIYNNLPPHLKALLLYLNMYPADYTIKKDDLVKQWVAEGFLSLVEGQDSEEVAEGYFDELVSRGMLQPVNTNCNGQVSTCTVHHMILDLISYISMEENFVTTADYFQTGLGFSDKVRRLSVQFGGARGASMPVGIRMSHLRSLTFFGFIKCLPSIVNYKLLRVLVLHIWADQEKMSCDLTRVCELFLLKFLNIQCNVTVRLPAMMQDLKFLETLEVDARVDAVPSDIVGLKRLLHLHLPSGTALPDGIGQMISLRTLGYFYLTSSNLENNMLNLGMLTNLQELHLSCPTSPYGRLLCNMDFVGSVLTKLSNVKSLTLVPGSCRGSNLVVATSRMNDIGLSNVPSPQALIQKLDLLPGTCMFSSLPKWIRPLDKLYTLKIAVKELSSSDIDLLKELPTLTALSLHVQTTPSILIAIGEEGFQILRFFALKCALVCLTFHKGAMPNVERIKLGFCVNKEGLSSCENAALEHLTSLKQISAKVWSARAEDFDRGVVENIESDVQTAIKNMFFSSRKRKRSMQSDSSVESTTEEIVKIPIINVRCIQDTASPMFFESSASGITAEFDKKRNKSAIVTENAMVTAAMGAMSSVLVKLGILMEEQYSKHASTQKQAMALKYELDAVNTILEQLADSGEKKDGRKEMRDITYDIEDCIDELIFDFDKTCKNTILEQLAHSGEKKDGRKGTRDKTYDIEDYIHEQMIDFDKTSKDMLPEEKKTSKDIDKTYDFHDKKMTLLATTEQPEEPATLQKFIDQVRNLKGKMENAADPEKIVHKSEMDTSGSGYYVASELRLSRFYDKGMGLGGFDGAREQLAKQLMGGEQERQVVCILGYAGVGKTTLAKEVYNMICARFDDQVFITVSNNNVDIELMLLHIKQKKGIRENSRKRYLIAIDGIRSSQQWDNIKHNLPTNDYGNRIIITTCDSVVADSCGKDFSSFLYRMEPLTFENSLSLFQSIIFGSGGNCPAALKNYAEKIVKACGGMPLAISVIAGVLASKPAEMGEWDMFEKRMAGINPPLNAEGMGKILYISYSDLPGDMQTCLLYLSAFPDNYLIMKDSLIRRWNAEGFLPKIKEENWWETGERFFLELMARRLIEPVFLEDPGGIELVEMGYGEMPLGCKVSSLVHDFITSMSSEENLVLSEASSIQNKVIRGLSLSSDSNDYKQDVVSNLSTENKSKVRSFTLRLNNYYHFNVTGISDFRHLRVLDLKDEVCVRDHRLQSITNLSLLRYLGLAGIGVLEQLDWIYALEHLETLDVRRTNVVVTLPKFTSTKLVCVLADHVEMASQLPETRELEELSMLLVNDNKSSSRENVVELIKRFKHMRTLGLWFNHCPKQYLELVLDCWAHTRPRHLRKFELRLPPFYYKGLSKVPENMIALVDLTHLRVDVTGTEADEGICILGNLPNLVSLNLTLTRNAPRRRSINKDIFRRLKVFRCNFYGFYGGGGMWLKFEQEAMPQLRWLDLKFKVAITKDLYDKFDFGIQHLSCLRQVRATIDCEYARVWDVETAEAAMKDQVSQIPNYPILHLSRTNHFYLLR